MNKQLIVNTKEAFKERFYVDPLLVFSPGRINLIGEHTDYNNGLVFPAAIDKGIVVAIQKTELEVCSIVALDINETLQFSLNNLNAIEKGSWKNYVIGVVAEIRKTGKILHNFNLVFGGDIPSGAGLSSSAAMENGIVFGLNELFNLGLLKEEMIFISQKAEHNYVGVNCGIMDQYASMFGLKNSAIKLDCRDLSSEIIKLELNEYAFLLINTNVKHSLEESTYNERRETCESISKTLGKTSLREVNLKELNAIKKEVPNEDFNKALYVLEENNRVVDAHFAIKENNIMKLGKLFFDSHKGLRDKYKVSCRELDYLVDLADRNSNIIGARMMGGGFGGCTINIVKRDAIQNTQEDIAKSFKKTFGNPCSFYPVILSNGTRKISGND